ncbi:hypothetical protein COOONC_25003 [Cooperia oncophora]
MSERIFKQISTIVALREQGKSILAIEPSLSYQTIRRFVRKFEGAPSPRKSVTPRALRVHYNEILSEVERCYANNSSATAIDILNRLNTRGITISTTHIKRLRRRLGYKKTTTKYCHTIRDTNKVARLDFCSEMLAAGVVFSDCVFTDECTVQIDCSTKFCFVKQGDQYSRMRSRAKHPAKVHIWGGISVRGTTQFAILPGNCRIDSELYCRILERCYLPFQSKVYNGYCRLVQDNAPPHKSRYTSDKLRSWGVDTMAWPAESPDLNPIELVWGNMKVFIRKQGVRSLEELKVAIVKYWKTLTPEECVKYVGGIRSRMERVVEQRGRNIIENK